MSEATIIYWRDIPTQVVVGGRRRGTKRMLADRFMVAVDKAADAAGLTNEDAYLAEWRSVKIAAPEDDDKATAEAIAARLEDEYPATRLAALARQGGREQ